MVSSKDNVLTPPNVEHYKLGALLTAPDIDPSLRVSEAMHQFTLIDPASTIQYEQFIDPRGCSALGRDIVPQIAKLAFRCTLWANGTKSFISTAEIDEMKKLADKRGLEISSVVAGMVSNLECEITTATKTAASFLRGERKRLSQNKFPDDKVISFINLAMAASNMQSVVDRILAKI